MKLRKTISEESLRRLWSEISLLRHEVAQAERDRVASQVQLTSAIEVTQAQLSKPSRPVV